MDKITGGKKSVIDYAITKQEDEDILTSMEIDEAQEYTPYRKLNENGTLKKVYTDHCTIILQLNILVKESKGTSFKLTVTHKGYTKYRQLLQSSEINSMVEHDDFQTMYDRWTQAIEGTIQQVQTKVKKRNSRIEVRKLCKIKIGLKNQLRHTKDQKVREILITRIHLMKEHIQSQWEEAEANIIKIIQQLNEKNRLYAPKIWKIKRKVTRATETPHSVKTSNGELMESRQGILGAYRTHYQNLLRIKVGKTELEKTTETMVEKQFKSLSMRETESHRKEITNEIVKKAIKMMRNKRALDRRGWRAEWLKNGGEEIENSLVKLFNRMERENTIPLQ